MLSVSHGLFERRVILMVMDGFSPVAETKYFRCMFVYFAFLSEKLQKDVLSSRSQNSTRNSNYFFLKIYLDGLSCDRQCIVKNIILVVYTLHSLNGSYCAA